jgi:hypothetical protein
MLRAYSIVLVLSAFLVFWFRVYLVDAPLPAVDLPGHVSLFEFLKQQSLNPLGFYDPRYFGGYPALTFYGPLPAIITVGLAYLFGIGCQFAANLIMVSLLAALPVAILFAARPFYEESGSKNYWLLGLWVSAISFWFINHDSQWHGIGAAAITNIGLYSQLFAWFPLLFIVGVIGREVVQKLSPFSLTIGTLLISLALAVLFYTHTVTFAFAVGYVILMALTQRRFDLLLCPFAALIFALPYSYYFLSNVSEFAPFDIYSPKGDFIGAIFRYPLIGIWDGISAAIQHGIFTKISLIELLLYPLALLTILNKNSANALLFRAQIIFVMVSVLLTSSDYVAKSLGLSLHYYRFISLNFILSLPIVIEAIFLTLPCTGKFKVLSIVGSALLATVSLLSQLNLPHYERKRVELTAASPYLSTEDEVVKKIEGLPAGSRVITEYFSDYTKFPFLSAHYIGTQLVKTGRIENAGGLFVQSALTYKYAAAYLEALQGDTYHVSQQIIPKKYQSSEALIRGLAKMGVTHVLGATEKLAETLKQAGVPELFKLGRYYVFQISEPVKISQITAPLIGYFDEKGNLPFRMLDQYFAEDPARLNGYEFVELSNLRAADKVDFVLINSSSTEHQIDRPHKVIEYSPISPLWHYSSAGELDRELVRYKRAKEFLKKVILDKVNFEPPLDVSTPEFKFDATGQRMSIKYLVPGARYRICYSYFPFWHGPGLMRGSYNQMVVVAGSDEVELSYK